MNKLDTEYACGHCGKRATGREILEAKTWFVDDESQLVACSQVCVEALERPRAPYIGYSNATLADCPDARVGEEVECPVCDRNHTLEASEPKGVLLFFRCDGSTYIGAINGKLVLGKRPDVSGDVPTTPRTVDRPCAPYR